MAERTILIQPRSIDVPNGTTLLSKLKTVGIGASKSDAQAGELFVENTGYAFIARETSFKIAGSGTNTDETHLVPIMTPTDILPKFAAPASLGTGNNILFHTVDTRNSSESNLTDKTPDSNGKFKQFSILQLKEWINASIAGDLTKIGLIKVNNSDATPDYLSAKLKTQGSSFISLNATTTVGTDPTMTITASASVSSEHFAISATNELIIATISGGTI